MLLDPANLLEKWGSFAPYIIFLLALLAGLNFPISIDILVTITAIIAAKYLPEKTYLLFSLFTLGCIFSAWLSYSVGRTFTKFIKKEKSEKIANYIKKFGFLVFLVCRFVPFGIRNALFMTSGFSKFPFKKFAIYDAISCTIWSTIFFSLIYNLGTNFEIVLGYFKKFNLIIIALFSILILVFAVFLWKKRTTHTNTDKDQNSKDLL
jgi:membrane-associated protein